jgi:heme-binding protein
MVAAAEEEMVTRRRAVGAIVVGMFVLAAAIQLVRPARTNPATDPLRTLQAMVPVSPQASAVLERGCRDCHSNDTKWPWYSNVAPVSWFVIDHVNHGRSHFNYSDWAKYDAKRRREILEDSCAMARKKEMPLPSYLWAHGDARLSAADVAALCEWTDSALRTLSRP